MTESEKTGITSHRKGLSEAQGIIIGAIIGFVAAIAAALITASTLIFKTQYLLTLDKLEVPVLAQPAKVNNPPKLRTSGTWLASVDVEIDGRHDVSSYELQGTTDQSQPGISRSGNVPLNRQIVFERSSFNNVSVVNISVKLTPLWDDTSQEKEYCKEGTLVFSSILVDDKVSKTGTTGKISSTRLQSSANESYVTYRLEKR